jgi:NAD(P)-dependent dehydrogenase (short-subunit alcohol dehydrogenase family)
MTEIADTRIAITGAASGIGLAIAEHLATQGASVLLIDNRGEAVEAAARRIGGSTKWVRADVTVAADVEMAVRTATEQFGGLDVLINNAGAECTAPLIEHDEADFDRVVAVNLKGTFLGIKYGAPAIASSGGGSIINIGSIAGMRAVPYSAAYCASKAAMHSLTQVAALELRPLGIRVNSISPGLIQTPMLETASQMFEAVAGANTFVTMVEQVQGRMGTPADVATLAAFLISDEASLINGANFPVDGGTTAKLY